MSGILDFLQVLSFVVVGGTTLTSAILYFRSKNKDREKETFDYIDDKFNEYLQICLDKPHLDIFDVEDEKKTKLTSLEKKEEKVAFSYLISVFERVFIFYKEHGKKCDIDQFENWTKTIKEYMSRENFRITWKENGYGWDSKFILFMDKLYLKAQNKIDLILVESPKNLEKWANGYKKYFSYEDNPNNDHPDHLGYYLKERKKNPYIFYSIEDNAKKMVGGMLIQKIKNAVIILYLFIDETERRKQYANYALQTLRSHYDEKTYFVAEVEHTNKEHKPFWLANYYSEVDFKYYTPADDDKKLKGQELLSSNDLLIFQSKPISTKTLNKVLKVYFETSYIKNGPKSISEYESAAKNLEQLKDMKTGIVEFK